MGLERLTGTANMGVHFLSPSERKFDEQTDILRQVRDRLPAMGGGQVQGPEN